MTARNGARRSVENLWKKPAAVTVRSACRPFGTAALSRELTRASGSLGKRPTTCRKSRPRTIILGRRGQRLDEAFVSVNLTGSLRKEEIMSATRSVARNAIHLAAGAIVEEAFDQSRAR